MAEAALITEGVAALPRERARSPAGAVVLAAIGTRILGAVAMWLGTFSPRVDYRFWNGMTPGGLHWAYLPSRLLDGFGRWDTWYYLRIAAVGYRPPHGGSWALEGAFFPLFPALVRGASALTGLPLYTAGLLASWGAFALAIRAVYRLFVDVAGEAEGAWATTALLVFPASFFLTAVYTESLFLFLSVTALAAARRRAFGLAGAAAALATLTRPNGLLLLLPIGLEALAAWRSRERIGAGIAALALPILALATHAVLLTQVYGDPLYFQHIQQVWGRHFSAPWVALLQLAFDPDYYLITLGALAAVASAWRQHQPASLQAHGALSILLPLCTGSMKSIPRFTAVDFPLFLTLARWTRTRRLRVLYTVGALLLFVVYAFRFARGDAIN